MKRMILIIVCLLILFPYNTIAKESSSTIEKDYLNSVKITFLSWTSGSTKISYERAFKNIHQSGELCVGVIGAGFDKYNNNPKGYTLRYGHKFFTNDNQEKSLMGWYLRPEIVYSNYTYDKKSNGFRSKAEMVTILGTLGYQYVYKRFLADFWVGGGYAAGTPAETYYHHGFLLWHFFGSINTKFALSFSIRLGICF